MQIEYIDYELSENDSIYEVSDIETENEEENINIDNNETDEEILSRPKMGREWHPHLSYYVSEPTNLNLTISSIMNKIQCGRLKTH